MSTILTKNARMDVRVTSEHKEMIEKAARLSGVNVSDFIVSKSVAAAAKVLEQQNKMTLSKRDWERFLVLLEAEDEPTDAAKAAAARYNEGRIEGKNYQW